MPSATDTQSGSELAAAYAGIRREAQALAGGPGDMPQRVALMHSIFEDSGRNHAFPEVALHGALWAYGFYERRGAVSRMITYRYFYDRDERARRAYMLFVFSQGFKDANRSVFMDTYANYFFTKRYGDAPGAEAVVAPELLDALNRVHHAARAGRALKHAERADVFRTSLLFEQETTVGPKVREEVAKFRLPGPDRDRPQARRPLQLLPAPHHALLPRLRQHRRADREGGPQLRAGRARRLAARGRVHPLPRRAAGAVLRRPARLRRRPQGGRALTRPARALALLAAAAVIAALAAPAGAAAFEPDRVEMDRAIRAADEFWRNDPQNHCLGHDGGSIDDTFPARHSTAAGYSRNGECGSIHILRSRVESYARWQFCTLVVHEYGHTIDYVHVSDPRDIMYAKPVTAGIHPRECDYPDPHGAADGEAGTSWAWTLEFAPSDWR